MKEMQKSKRNNLIMHVTLLMVALLSLKGLFGSVEGRQEDCGCHLIDKDQSAIYLKFEKASAHRNTESREKIVYFRIKNNTNCEVLLLSHGNYLRTVNGAWTSAVEDGEEVNVYYEIETERGRLKQLRISRFNEIKLLPGRSCIFPVQSGYLKKGNVLCVPCRYEWENASVRGSRPRSEALFPASELPRGWDK